MPSERAIARSVAPPSYLRRRISLTRRIDTLSAGHRLPRPSFPTTSKGPRPGPAVERWRHPSTGGRLQIGMAEIKSESVADFIPESLADLLRNQHPRPRKHLRASARERSDQTEVREPVLGIRGHQVQRSGEHEIRCRRRNRCGGRGLPEPRKPSPTIRDPRQFELTLEALRRRAGIAQVALFATAKAAVCRTVIARNGHAGAS